MTVRRRRSRKTAKPSGYQKVGVERLDYNRIPFYQQGAEGFFSFVEENVRFEVKKSNGVSEWLYPPQFSDEPDPITGKSLKAFWEQQKEELRPALKMKNGRFKYKLIVLCWMRGEGKSLDVVLIQLWKFFCFPRQLIVFGALSKDQTRFVHYDISQKIILNSPKLLNIIGKNNVQRGKLFLKNRNGEITSSIQPISSFSGIVSNITGYTFSEMFDMKDKKFFVQLDGSTRNIINALGTIDSTVSKKDHILYHLYKGFLSGKDKLIYFSYRSAPNASPDEFWSPYMDQAQLDSYRHRFPPADFDMYFRNSWELDSGKLFSEALVKAIFYIGSYNDKTLEYTDDQEDGGVLEICNAIAEEKAKAEAKDRTKNKAAKRRRRNVATRQRKALMKKLAELEARLVPVDDVYKLKKGSSPCIASFEDLRILGDKFNTNWSIHAGIDRADPAAQNPQARSIVTAVAKGLTNSRDSTNIVTSEREVPQYIYFLLHLAHVEDSTLEGIKQELKLVFNEFDGIDSICSERWGAWDLAPWCDEHEIKFETVFPTFDLQKKVFTELFVIVRNSRLKSPSIVVPGVTESNILKEEMEMFDYDPAKKWYGSPQKDQNGGIQDDSVFSLGLGIYGGREFGVDDFREREPQSFFGAYVPGPKMVGDYRDRMQRRNIR